MNRKLILALAVVALIALAGCADDGPSGDQLAKDAGGNVSGVNVGESYYYEVKVTEKNQYGLVKAQPPFQMDSSLERANLIRRFQYLNDRNNVHHVYLLSNDGKVIMYSMAQGKVSSVNSKLTNDQQIVRAQGCNSHQGSEGSCFKTVESPQMDGSYGENGDAIFWFTPEGQYIEWNGKYVVSEEPKNIQTQVTLVDNINDTTSNASA